MKQFFLSLFFLTISVFFFFSNPFHQSVFAQTNSMDSLYSDTNSDVPQNIHSLTQIVTLEVFSTIGCQIAGVDPMTANHQCLGFDEKTKKIGFVEGNGGLIGLTEKGIAFTYNIPLSSGTYVQYLSQNFGVAPKVYAQSFGTGFTSLNPLLALWVAIRNVIYLCFIVVFVLIGIGVMLRIQIDPRTVMTIENQLPKIVIALILITFSLAIAGALIDVMWVVTFFIINLLQSVDSGKGITSFTTQATNNIFDFPLKYFDTIWNGGNIGLANNVTDAAKGFIQNAFAPNAAQGLKVAENGTTATSACGTGDWGCDAAGFISALTGFVLTGFAGTIGWLVILLAIVISLIRVWIALLRVYIYLILNIILAPVYIFCGLIPGSTFGFGLWFRSVCAELTVYPAVIFLFLLARVLSDTLVNSSGLFEPPLIGNPNSGANVIGAILAFAILLICPNVPQFVDRIYGIEDNGAGQAIMRNFATGPQTLTNATRSAFNTFRDPVSGNLTGFNPLRLIPR